VKCFGENNFGQLGYGDTSNRGDGSGEMGDYLLNVDVGTGTVESISCGKQHNCVVLTNEQIKCWGRNGSGQLGYEDTTTRGDGSGDMGSNLDTVDVGTFPSTDDGIDDVDGTSGDIQKNILFTIVVVGGLTSTFLIF